MVREMPSFRNSSEPLVQRTVRGDRCHELVLPATSPCQLSSGKALTWETMGVTSPFSKQPAARVAWDSPPVAGEWQVVFWNLLLLPDFVLQGRAKRKLQSDACSLSSSSGKALDEAWAPVEMSRSDYPSFRLPPGPVSDSSDGQRSVGKKSPSSQGWARACLSADPVHPHMSAWLTQRM